MSDLYKQILERVDHMPQVSTSSMNLLQALSRQDFQVQQIIDIVESDISLTTRCLQVVNSAAYGLRNTVETIKQAVIFLGSQTLVSIALAQSFAGTFSTSLKGYGIEGLALWNHSIRTALASRVITKSLVRDISPDLAYTAGLMHDMGKAVITEFLEKHQQDLFNKLVEIKPGKDFLKLENELLGTDHAHVGLAMAKRWNFPMPLIQAIAWHHTVENARPEFRALVGVVHLADLIAMMGGGGTGVDTLAYHLDPFVEREFSLDRKALQQLIYKIDMEFLAVKDKLNSLIGKD